MGKIARIGLAAALASTSTAYTLAADNDITIKDTASQIAKGLFDAYYDPAATTGQFKQTHDWFWWLSGTAWNGLLDYTLLTNDTTYKQPFLDALAKNVGENYDFVPASQVNWEANDDQAYWVYNALTAMEYNFDPLPCPSGGSSSPCETAWVKLSSNAFDRFVSRWAADAGTCNGGLKWQFNPASKGYDYKNSVTNGGFFQTAARLARYTGDQKYADWANKVWDWSTGVGFVSADFHVVDGAGDGGSDNCTKKDKNEWTYNSATYMMGAANMFAYTNGDKVWEERVQGLVNTAKTQFFTEDGIMREACEASNKCNTDNTSFKSSLARWMGRTAVLVPSVRQTITDLLEKSATAAAKTCSGSTCGNLWTASSPGAGKQDFGTQLSALEIVQSLLVLDAPLKLATAQGAQAPEPAQPRIKFSMSVHKAS
ncbi:glycoside hydrolase family 76 protein [Apiospora hydei]|uniref:Mannan endo-1,6-alpha-mannosidase n=1 Tax=Apiospora hydei TaxID=1337664 RepID=A0ABR1V2Y3_9PEZI